MMDDATLDLLSRHLDGDLDLEDERKLALRLKAEPSLTARLEALRRVRASVAALAARETAPAELDNLIDPLLREPPQPLGVRPWVRWLGTAAAVVLGITVIIEVNRGDPGAKVGSMSESVDAARVEPTRRFALAPLPTSSLPPEQQPVGATERLLASPIPEVDLGDPRPLEVLGPLEERPGVAAGDTPGRDKGLERDAAGKAAALATERAPIAGAERPAPAARTDGRRAGVENEADDELEGEPATEMRSWEVEAPRGRAQLFVFIDGRSAWREFRPAASCKPGRYTVRIVVANGAVFEARPVGGAASAAPSQRLCAAELIVGLEIEDVSDGEYPAEVVVERRGVAADGLR